MSGVCREGRTMADWIGGRRKIGRTGCGGGRTSGEMKSLARTRHNARRIGARILMGVKSA